VSPCEFLSHAARPPIPSGDSWHQTSEKESAVPLQNQVVDASSERIGGHIRALRHSRGMTLVQLAEIAELSHPFLSQLERGHSRPSMVSLERIARALGSSPLELLAASEQRPSLPGASLVRRGAGQRGQYGFGEAELLVEGERRFQPMHFEAANSDPGEYHSHPEDEFVHALEGSVVVDLGSEGEHTLSPGDSLYYGAGTPHRWCTAVPGQAYKLFVVKQNPVM
jgi:transcriptional regulator with XRE-family HTH domain